MVSNPANGVHFSLKNETNRQRSVSWSGLTWPHCACAFEKLIISLMNTRISMKPLYKVHIFLVFSSQHAQTYSHTVQWAAFGSGTLCDGTCVILGKIFSYFEIS